MASKTIRDSELIDDADRIMIWIANIKAPKDMWSLREAVAWAVARPEAKSISLHGPSQHGRPALWIRPEQIERLAAALIGRSSSPVGARQI